MKIDNDKLMYYKPNYFIRFLSNAIFLVMVLLSLFLIGFSLIYISTPVVGESMQPTLNIKGSFKSDIVYVNRFASFSRGDIIVINQPNEESKNIIKRVIGIGGDKILISKLYDTNEIELYVNDKLQTENYIFDYLDAHDPNNLGMHTTYSNFNNLKYNKPELFNADGALIVPDGEVFVLGDNRGNSLDSSVKGTFSNSLVIGKVDFIIPYGQNEWKYLINKFTPFNVTP